ncbi:MAG TPA: methylmalonyl-CoA mutase family protein [Xanthobacteraceae bacterium]|jgi:methylmalonyl-CoA mutase|nr:methylmalonyl-CoA mutase family protein [Xanthobacteraceae bacterium]
MSDDLSLAAEFPTATYEQWRKLVDGVLKGAPFDKLVARTYDALPIEPLYPRAADAKPVLGRAPGAPWAIMQRVDHPDPAAANALALEDLANGASGLILVFAGSVSANGYGLDPGPETLARVLDGVILDAGIALDFNLSPATREAVRHFVALVRRRNLAPASIDMRASINPIGGFAASGSSSRPWAELGPSFAAMVGELADQGFRGPFAVADGRIIHNAGGSEAQELAFAIASGLAYLRALEAGGLPLDAARRMIYFRLSADADQFLTMAKFRAVRRLWARVQDACGLASPHAAHVAAETAWRMMTRRDPYVNMLRATIAVAAAALGGADSITVLPHTAALGLPDAFARRMARNTQLILCEESNLARVGDPVAGSGALEDITGKLCAAAWSQFQEIEAAGGAWAALKRGLIQAKVAAVRDKRRQAIAHRKDTLTGATDFPDLEETPPAVLAVPSVAAPKEAAAAVTTEPLPRIRLAEPFERLRDASDRRLAETGARPKVFLANLGQLSDFTARATFAKNFFEAGGIAAVTSDGFASRDAMVAAFKASGAKLVCLCSSDEIYENEAAAAAEALAGAAHIYLAGRPRAQEAALKAAGVGTFIFVGCDALATLEAAHRMLRIEV